MTDSEAMAAIQALLSGKEWDSGTLAEVAQIMREAGYRIADLED